MFKHVASRTVHPDFHSRMEVKMYSTSLDPSLSMLYAEKITEPGMNKVIIVVHNVHFGTNLHTTHIITG